MLTGVQGVSDLKIGYARGTLFRTARTESVPVMNGVRITDVVTCRAMYDEGTSVDTAAGDRVVTRAGGPHRIINVLHHLVNELCRALARVGELLDAGLHHEQHHHWGLALRLIISTKCHERSTGCQRNGVVVSSNDPDAEEQFSGISHCWNVSDFGNPAL